MLIAKRYIYILAFALFGAGTALGTHARQEQVEITPRFELPVDCDMGAVCTIHKYVDHDPSPARRDYACGRLSKDGDTGTDFRTPSYVEMEAGIAVIAAGAGTVLRVRDGMADISVRDPNARPLNGNDAGNAVIIDHGNGWHTQYSHLKKGSVAVKPGDSVVAGQELGMIGLSGNTEFPHVEFTVRHRGDAVDPFVGKHARGYSCGAERDPLWSATAQAALDYRSTGILTMGFGGGRIDAERARRGAYDQWQLTTESQALVVWADIFGAEAGDIQAILITDPGGKIIHKRQTTLKNNIAWFAFSGMKRPDQGWPQGKYHGSYQLMRAGEVIASRTRVLDLSE